MSEFKGKPISDRFFKMENDFKLFDFVSDEGLPIWDVLRYEALLAIKIPDVLNIEKRRLTYKLVRLHYIPFEIW